MGESPVWPGVDEVEGPALVGGGVGELVDFDVGVVVADAVAGEGTQVVGHAAEARTGSPLASRLVEALDCAVAERFAGATGLSRWGCVVGEGQWRPGLA